MAASPAAAEDAVDQEQHHDGQIAAEDDARVPGPGPNDGGRGVHELEQPRGEDAAHRSHQDGEHNSGADCLYGGHRRAFGIVFADAARYRRGGGHGETHGDGEDDHDDRFGESDRSHRVGTEARHPEGVDHAEGGFHHHLQDGGNGEQGDAPGQTALREILRGAGQRFAQELPLAAGCRPHGRLHLSLSGYSDPC